ncbi:MAG: sugar ABC transporter permease [Spirochaetales bacterium]|nr:sugar ABC transporter permease [Spirochaetales bacterium]
MTSSQRRSSAIQKTRGFSTIRKEVFPWIGYILPALLIYSVFMAYPLISSIGMSLFSANGVDGSTFVGFDNYIKLFSQGEHAVRYWGALGNTFYFFLIHMVIQNILGLLFALLLSSPYQKGSSVYRTIIFIPATLAVLVTGYLWKLILNPQWGAVNMLLKNLGLDAVAFAWLGEPEIALTVISLVSSWQWVGMPTMIFLAGLQTIPEDLFEAARIDGANGKQLLWNIKLPLLLPIVGIVSVLTFVNNFNAFDVVFAMENVNGAPMYSTDLLGTLFYRVGIAGQHPVGIPDRGMGAAIATITFFILILGVQLIQRFTRSREAR